MGTATTIVSVTTSAAQLLYQTSTGVAPDPETTQAGNATAQIFQAGTTSDPVRIKITNEDATNPVYLGGSGVTSTTGDKLAAGATLGPLTIVGNDSLYAISTGGTVKCSVMVGPFQ